MIRVGQQRKRQLVLGNELVMRFDIVGADAEHHRVQLGKLRVIVAKIARFRRAARGHVLGIKVQHYVLTAKIPKRNRPIAVRLQGKIRRRLSYCYHHEIPTFRFNFY